MIVPSLCLPAVADTIEFQKRGLPHAHILIWQAGSNREPSAAFVDQFISVELPDPSEDPLGFVLVQEFMMLGPCGELNPNCPCMKDGKCFKGFQRVSRTRPHSMPMDFLFIDDEILVSRHVKTVWTLTIDGLYHTTLRSSRNSKHISCRGLQSILPYKVPFQILPERHRCCQVRCRSSKFGEHG